MLRILKFRNFTRDYDTDQQRLNGLLSAVREVLTNVDSEAGGLSRRVEETRGRVGSIMGNEDGSYFEREPAVEASLQKSERELLAGTERLVILKLQRNYLIELEDQLRKFPKMEIR
jgi:hypothetical protein